jgi:CRP-like cAMP-binding protein
MTTTTSILGALSSQSRERLMELARDVSFDAGDRVFEEGEAADRFWIIRTGTVCLDLRIPGRRTPTVETLHPGDLLGWSWFVPPYTWHLGAEALSPVRALEFDADAVRALCERDVALEQALTRCVAEVVGRRLRAARTRLAGLHGSYSPYSSYAEDPMP